MMPQLVTVEVRRVGGRCFRIWVPVLPVAIVLSPVVVQAVLGAIVVCLIFHVSVGRGLSAAWRFVAALPGARFDIEQGGTAVLVAIR